jgi:hypothetical protein
LGPIVTKLLLLIFGPGLFKLLVKWVSSFLEPIKCQKIVHKEPQLLWSHLNCPNSPWRNPGWSTNSEPPHSRKQSEWSSPLIPNGS